MLQITQASRTFGSIQALRSVSLTVAQGEFLALLGPSGCGKTTLLRAIAGLETLDSGQLELNGSSLAQVSVEQRPFHLVFQRYALFPHLSVFENVAFGLRIRRTPESDLRMRVQDALRLLKLEGFDDRAIATLSGGQSQRVALARAIVNQPKLLLLDEPLSALDRQLREQMQFELKELQRRLATTFILVTHDQEEAMALADRIVVMNQGAIEQVGTPSEIYHSPKTRFVAEFMGTLNALPIRGRFLRPEHLVVSLDHGGIIGRRARCVGKSFLGSNTRLKFAIGAAGETWVAQLSHSNIEVGQMARLHWREQDVIVLGE